MIKTFGFIYLTISLLLLLYSSFYSPLSFSQSNKSITIATAPFPTFRYQDDKGKTVGSDIEIVEQVFAQIGYVVKFDIMPLSRAEHLLKEGKIAGFVTLTKNPEREQYLLFSDEINTVKDVFFKRKEDKIHWNTLADLKEYRIGESGYNYAPIFKEAVKNKLLTLVESIKVESPELMNLEKLKNKRIDLFICEVSVCWYLIQSSAGKFANLNYINKEVGDIRPFYLTFSKKYADAEKIRDQFNTELKKFVAAGNRKAIYLKYGIMTTLP
ncbi:MAG: transporter substrate-binding domain-containing protein [Oligoflexia bacterium]|nr:transporter substrate-binding domain-containing protein [Oligoflexia bacterium]